MRPSVLSASHERPHSWKAVAYVRLSREDDEAGESASIQGQRTLIASWAEREGVSIVRWYVDDGFSGATFDRPGFEHMIADAQRGCFDTIVVKDLSRLGRSYLDCGILIERELPKLGVRLYSIADSFDSMAEPTQDMALLLPMKNLINEMHVIATSEKVRSSLAARRERGEFVGNWAPYGYRRDPCERHRLAIDQKSAQVVRRIFRMRLEGISASAIARTLNEEDVPSPALYRRRSGEAYATSFGGEQPAWHAKTILRILRDETYVGTLVQGKTRRASWRLHASLPVPRQDWTRMPHAHEALVDARTFARVAELVGW